MGFFVGHVLICYTVFKSFQIYLHVWAQIDTNQPPNGSGCHSLRPLQRNKQNTAQAYQTQGVLIIPMVVESTGCWDPEAHKIPKHIAYASAVRLGRDPAEMLALFL